jgi:hypothetical protein
MDRERRTGIIDTISSAYGLVYRRPALLLPPILLDLFLWFGPRLSIEGPLRALADLLASQADAGQQEEAIAVVQAAAAQSDVFALLALQVPSMMRLLSPAQTPLAANRPVVAIDEPATAALAGLLLSFAGLLLSMVYLVPIGQIVRDGRFDPKGIVPAVGRAWLRQVGLLLLLIGGGLAVALPLAVITALLAVAGIGVLPLVQFAVSIAAIWLVVYLFFAIDAIVVSEVGPLRAIRYSVAVVRHNFWSTLGLIGLTFLISWQLPELFKLIARNAIGVPIAIVANAFISTGLVAAAMLFYRERLARWQQQQRAAALSRVGPGAPR